MGRSLNIDRFKEVLAEKGLNQSQLAGQLKVTRAAVSKWMKGKAVPRPGELLKLGRFLELKFDELMVDEAVAPMPLIAFRKKAGTVTTDEHIERAKKMGKLLSPLVRYLPFDEFVAPQRLKMPRLNYDYIQELVVKVRRELMVDSDGPIKFQELISKFNELQAVIVPVMWGRKQRHENALHVYLPDSQTTWVFLNLDSNRHDFKYWMAHELGHVLSVNFLEDKEWDKAEDFAESFAGALLFPKEDAEEAFESYRKKKSDKGRIELLMEVALEFVISPFSVYKEMERFCVETEEPFVEIEQGVLHSSLAAFNKHFKTVSEDMFGDDPPSAEHFMRRTVETFKTPFFKALDGCSKDKELPDDAIRRMLDVSLFDAREFKAALA